MWRPWRQISLACIRRLYLDYHEWVFMFVLSSDAPPALPFWIDGHAVLTLGERFLDVRQAKSGAVVRRLPVCGADEARRTVVSAMAAHARWSARPVAERKERLSALAGMLSAYSPHFAALLDEEGGMPRTEAEQLVAAAQACLESVQADSACDRRIVVVKERGRDCFLATVSALSRALVGGACVVVLSDPDSPSALLALAELATRSGLPDGVFNLIHGDAHSANVLALALASEAMA